MAEPEIIVKRRCAFCGSAGKMSGEHAWPNWIAELLPAQDRDIVTINVTDSHLGHVRTYRERLFSMRIKGVCEPCNNGWMSQLENAVKPLISGMLLGCKRQLHPTGQATIATWAVLKVLVMQLAFPREGFSRSQYEAMYAGRAGHRPPEGFRVYTARVAHTERRAQPGIYRWHGVARHTGEPVTPETPVEGYLATLTVLDLMVQVFCVNHALGGADAEWIHKPQVARAMTRLWPEPQTFTWPGGQSLTASGVEVASGVDMPNFAAS